MHLIGQDGSELSVTLVGYEFPDATAKAGHEEEANWLEVKLFIRNAQGAGWCQTPCLKTWEVSMLAEWLRDRALRLPDHSIAANFMVFHEPNLQLRFEEDTSTHVSLHVTFNFERPGDWTIYGQSGDKPTWSGRMSLAVPHEQLLAASGDLLDQLRRFPAR